jgi:hypothetical protein
MLTFAEATEIVYHMESPNCHLQSPEAWDAQMYFDPSFGSKNTPLLNGPVRIPQGFGPLVGSIAVELLASGK